MKEEMKKPIIHLTNNKIKEKTNLTFLFETERPSKSLSTLNFLLIKKRKYDL